MKSAKMSASALTKSGSPITSNKEMQQGCRKCGKMDMKSGMMKGMKAGSMGMHSKKGNMGY